MKLMKLLTIVIMPFLFLNISTISYAQSLNDNSVNETVYQKAVELLDQGYMEYYNFYDSNATLICRQENQGMVEEYFLLEINVMLKANTVQEIDYYQGVAGYQEERLADIASSLPISTSTTISRDDSHYYADYSEALSEEVAKIYDNLNQYIGEKQLFIFYVLATYDSDNLDTINILVDDGFEYIPVINIYPPSREELKKNGYESLKFIDDSVISIRVNSDDLSITTSASYKVDDAVSYMKKYTSNPTSCNVHSGCSSYVDTSKYNSSYTTYVGTNNGVAYHTDCANYVSQALNAGGIPTDTKWKKDTTAWVGVSKLTEYMVDKGYWEETSQLAVGSIISHSAYSHVTMVTSHDGTSYKFSAHTNDRKDVVASTSSSNTFYSVIY